MNYGLLASMYKKQKHLTKIYFSQNLRQLYIITPITTVRGPLQPGALKLCSLFFLVDFENGIRCLHHATSEK